MEYKAIIEAITGKQRIRVRMFKDIKIDDYLDPPFVLEGYSSPDSFEVDSPDMIDKALEIRKNTLVSESSKNTLKFNSSYAIINVEGGRVKSLTEKKIRTYFQTINLKANAEE